MKQPIKIEKVNKLLKSVPLSSVMKIEANTAVFDYFSLKAPISVNKNDKNTAFAGSIYSLAALSGWSYLSLLLESASIDAFGVLYKANIAYTKPILDDFKSACPFLSDEQKNQIFEDLKNKGKTKVLLEIDVISANEKKAHFSNLYVLKLKS